MPTFRVYTRFNPKVTGPKGWLPGDDDDALRGPDKYILAAPRLAGRPESDRLRELEGVNRWFHFEFWRVFEGVERYSRIALFGVVEEVDGEHRFFLQRLSNVAAESRKDLSSLERELKKKAAYLHKGRVTARMIKADVSWHELDRSGLCRCFPAAGADGARGESADERNRRLHSLSEAHPVGRIYFMYCFTLDDYFKHARKGRGGNQQKKQGEFTEAQRRAVEKAAYDFYVGDDCQLEKETFRIKVSTEEGADGTGGAGGAAAPAEPPARAEKRVKPVRAEKREKQLKHDGIDFAIFRTKLRSNDWLNDKTYRVRIGPTVEYFLRLSQTGLIEVRQEVRLLGEEDKSLAKILEGLLRFRRVDAGDEGGFTDMSWELNSIVEQFAKYVVEGSQARAAAEGAGGRTPAVAFTSKMKWAADAEGGGRKKHRDRRYVAIVLRDLKCGNDIRPPYPRPGKCGRSIKPTDILRNIEVASSFLEGTMIYNEKSSDLQIPARPPLDGRELPDLSSWTEEICFLESDRTLIYFEPKTILESYNHVANYEAYWRAVVRGVEHQLSIRTCLQKMETTTTKLTERIPGLLTGPAPGARGGAGDANPELDGLASDVSEVVSLLPKLRQISTTATAFRSGKAIEKFDRLGRHCFQFPELVRNIQQNVNELGDFLQYAKAQEMRQALIRLSNEIDEKAREDKRRELVEAAAQKMRESVAAAAQKERELAEAAAQKEEAAAQKRRDDKLVRIGLLIAGSSIFFSTFSFLIDADSFFTKFYAAWASPQGLSNTTGTKALIIYLTFWLLFALIIWRAPKYFEWAELTPEERKQKGFFKSFLWARGEPRNVFVAGLLLLAVLFGVIAWG